MLLRSCLRVAANKNASGSVWIVVPRSHGQYTQSSHRPVFRTQSKLATSIQIRSNFGSLDRVGLCFVAFRRCCLIAAPPPWPCVAFLVRVRRLNQHLVAWSAGGISDFLLRHGLVRRLNQRLGGLVRMAWSARHGPRTESRPKATKLTKRRAKARTWTKRITTTSDDDEYSSPPCFATPTP